MSALLGEGGFECDAVETPDTLKILIGHCQSAEDGVGNGNGIVANLDDGDAMVNEKGILNDGEGNICFAELADGVEMTETTIKALGTIAVLNGFIKGPGQSSYEWARVGKDS